MRTSVEKDTKMVHTGFAIATGRVVVAKIISLM